MCKMVSFTFTIIFFLLHEASTTTQKDSPVLFQETDLIQASGLENAKNRQPISQPNVCKENELLYPGDQDDDWVCDCLPAYVYYPSQNKCFPLYRQGPCQKNQYLVLKSGKYTPECEQNACGRDGVVRYQNRCYTLGSKGPCRNRFTNDVIQVNETTLEIGCVDQRRYVMPTIINRFQEELMASGCPLGSRRKYENKCSNKRVQYWPAQTACGANENLYEGETEYKRICDCKPGFLFYPEQKSCFSAYKQGPCQSGKVIGLNGDTVECVETECKSGEIKYEGECYQLDSQGPCSDNEVITVDYETLNLKCSLAELINNNETKDNAQTIQNIATCPRGGKRDENNKCSE